MAQKIEIPNEYREALLKWKRSPITQQKLIRRAEIVLAAAEGLSNKAISERGLGSVQTICLWRKRYAEYGLEGLEDQPKPSRPHNFRPVSSEKARRRHYSVLDNYHLPLLGMDDISPWPEALRDYMREKGHLS